MMLDAVIDEDSVRPCGVADTSRKPWEEFSDFEVDCWIVEHCAGGRWYSFPETVRDRKTGVETTQVVRQFWTQRPTKNELRQWTRYAKEEGGEFRLATGDEPIKQIRGTGDAMRAPRIPAYSDRVELVLPLAAKILKPFVMTVTKHGVAVMMEGHIAAGALNEMARTICEALHHQVTATSGLVTPQPADNATPARSVT